MTTTKLISITPEPNPTLELLETLDKFIRWNSKSAKFFLAGGAVRRAVKSQTIGASDIDIFFPSFNDYLKVLNVFGQFTSGTLHPNCRQFHIDHQGESPFSAAQIEAAAPVIRDVEVKTKFIPIQLINGGYYDSPEDLIDSFDFTVCQMLYHKGQYLISEQGLNDELQGILEFRGEDYDINRFKHQRLIKYCKYGYEPTLELFHTVFLTPDALHPGDFTTNDSGAEYDL